MTSLDIIAAAPGIWFAAIAAGIFCRLLRRFFDWLVLVIGR